MLTDVVTYMEKGCLNIHQKLSFCAIYEFATTWGWVNDAILLIWCYPNVCCHLVCEVVTLPHPDPLLSSLKACQSEEDLRCALVSPYPTGEMNITSFSSQALRLTPALSDPPPTHTHKHKWSPYQGTCKDASPPPRPTGLHSSLLFVPVNEREKLEKLLSVLSALSFLSKAESVPLSGSVFY